MILKFAEWLIEQQDRDDFVGDLARAPELQHIDRKPTKGKVDEHKDWVDIVIKLAHPGYVYAFNDAWQEFLLQKKIAEEAPVL